MADEKVIRYGDRTMPLEPGMTLEQAKELMARHFPELADPKIETKRDGDKTVYTFSKKAGHKGRGARGHNSRRRRGSDYARALHALEQLAAVEVVGKALLHAETTKDGKEYARAMSEGHTARLEAETVIALRQALADVPTNAAPSGSVL